MTAVLETAGLTKRFGRRTALRDCEMSLPAGKVVGLVGPNGAGKTTLLQLAIGLRAPTAGRIAVLGLSPTTDTVALLARAGFVGQDRPLYPDFTAGEMLEAGRRLNPRWDAAYATARLRHFGIALDRRIRTLSTGQRAQVALALALGKRPELLLLDEPVANLDPVARLELLEELMGAVAADGLTVVLSANALADVERVCDHLVILIDGRVRLAGDTEQLVAEHVLVVGPRLDLNGDTTGDRAGLPVGAVIETRHAERQTLRLVRGAPMPSGADGTVVRPATLEEVVVGYLRTASREVH